MVEHWPHNATVEGSGPDAVSTMDEKMFEKSKESIFEN